VTTRRTSPKTPFTLRQRRTSGTKPDDYPFSVDTEVAFITAKTSSALMVSSFGGGHNQRHDVGSTFIKGYKVYGS